MNRVQQGASFEFEKTFSSDDAENFTVVFDVLQYAGDTPAIAARAMTHEGNGKFSGVLLTADTDALAVGQWLINIRGSDSDENVKDPIKLYISKKLS